MTENNNLTISGYQLTKLLFLLLFLKNSGIEELCVTVVSRFSVTEHLFHSTRKICRGILLCFRKSLESENSMHKRRYGEFPWKIFCLTIPKNFVKETPWCLRVLTFAWHKLHLHALKYNAGKILGKKV